MRRGKCLLSSGMKFVNLYLREVWELEIPKTIIWRYWYLQEEENHLVKGL